jgi:hypothetical protein
MGHEGSFLDVSRRDLARFTYVQQAMCAPLAVFAAITDWWFLFARLRSAMRVVAINGRGRRT